MQFSVDGGACWGSVALSAPIDVYNVQARGLGGVGRMRALTRAPPPQTRPDNGGLVMVMHGALPESARRLGVYVLDFGALLAGAGLPQCAATDFEAWAPDSCQRGSAAILTRRKPHARCLPAPSWAPQPAAARACGCSAADYECEYGYERLGGAADGACVPMPDFAVDAGCPPLPAAATRRVAGDTCADPAPAPGAGRRGGRRGGGPSGGVIFLIVLLVLAAVGAAALFGARLAGLPLPPALRDGVDDCIAAVRGGYGRMRGAPPLGSQDDAWLDGPDAEFAPLAGGGRA